MLALRQDTHQGMDFHTFHYYFFFFLNKWFIFLNCRLSYWRIAYSFSGHAMKNYVILFLLLFFFFSLIPSGLKDAFSMLYGLSFPPIFKQGGLLTEVLCLTCF